MSAVPNERATATFPLPRRATPQFRGIPPANRRLRSAATLIQLQRTAGNAAVFADYIGSVVTTSPMKA